jgi:hypothetical protein
MINLDCNIHASSFVKGGERDEFDDVVKLQDALGLDGVFTFTYTYPLSNPAKFEHVLTPGMNGEDILALGRDDYEKIYAAEEDPGHIPGMLNRAQSEGPYGIWGHDFSDLYFEGIDIDTEKKTLKFSMGS